MLGRSCSRTGCPERAVATLTYVYADSMAVVGPLAQQIDPHGYDLCSHHAGRLSAPRGWEVIRLSYDPDPDPAPDDLLALADAVREVGLGWDEQSPAAADTEELRRRTGVIELGRRGHLRVLADPDA